MIKLEKNDSEKTGLKARVQPFGGEAGRYYSIHYKMPGSLIWNRLEETCTVWENESLNGLGGPVLFKDFDEACKYATGLTPEKIKNHNTIEKAKYENHLKEIEEAKEKRNRSQEFEL